MEQQSSPKADERPWCIYCAGRRGDPNLSDEHIWPAALGGGACPQYIFRTRQVCRGCNNTIGQWVDGAFYKSWFIQHEVGVSALQYLDPSSPGILPPIYMGFDTEIPLAEGLACERWLSPAGDHIYHIHQKDEDRWVVFAGGDFIRRRVDAGRVYVAITSHHVYWAQTTLASVSAYFPKAKRRSLTTFVGMETPGFLAPDEQLTTEEAAEIAFIYGRSDHQQQHLPLQIDFADRFLAKLSLGLGHTVLGRAVSASPYAANLRNLLWSRDAATRDQLGVRGSGFWHNQDPTASQLMNWPGAWCLLMTAMQEGFALNLCTPGGRLMTMNISDGATVWPISMQVDFRPGAGLHQAAEATMAQARARLELHELVSQVPQGGFAAFWERTLQAELADFTGVSRAKDEAALRELYRSLLVVPSTHSMPMWATAMQRGRGRQFLEKGLPDIAGEVSFCIAALLLLNTVNGINRQREDLAPLNRARAKRGRAPLREFVVTRLRLAKAVERGLAASGLSRQEARRHWVRGHFKVRATGVFWWSPYSCRTSAANVKSCVWSVAPPRRRRRGARHALWRASKRNRGASSMKTRAAPRLKMSPRCPARYRCGLSVPDRAGAGILQLETSIG